MGIKICLDRYSKHRMAAGVDGYRRCRRCNRLGRLGVPIEARFWEKVDRSGGPDACWIWTGYKHPDGYGVFTWGNQKVGDGTFLNCTTMAHKYAWGLAGNKVPDFKERMSIDHMCRTRACVNVKHLRVLPLAENVRLAVRKKTAL